MTDHCTNLARLSLHFVEPDVQLRAELVRVGTALGHHCEIYSDYAELADYAPSSGIIFARDSLEVAGIGTVIEWLATVGISLPVVAMEREPVPSRIVQTIKEGALDYLALPMRPEVLANCLARIGGEAVQVSELRQRRIDAKRKVLSLSRREIEVLEGVTIGYSNKEMARWLNISPRTVEIHRSNMMVKLGVRHSAEAIRIGMEAGFAQPEARRLEAA